MILLKKRMHRAEIKMWENKQENVREIFKNIILT
jgi:hypothetical protein